MKPGIVKRLIVRIFTATILAFTLGAASAQQEVTPLQRELFNQGVRFFNARQYAASAEAFAMAKNAGLNTPRLHVNYGVVLFRLGRYDDAIESFMRVPSSSEDYERALYNIGLVYNNKEEYGNAARYFARAGREAESERVRKLALTALEDAKKSQARYLAGSPFIVARRVDRVRGAFVANLGYDSNATLSAEASQIGVSNSEDFFVEGSGDVQFQLGGNRANGERLLLTGVVRRYEDVDAFNQAVGRVQFKVDRPLGLWTGTIGAEGDTIYLDDERFTSSGSILLEARGPLTARRFGANLSYRGSFLDGGSDFESLSGQRHTLRGAVQMLSRGGLTEVGYAFEVNDRDDLEFDNGLFFSRSPTYHSFFASHRIQVNNRFSIEPEVTYRMGRYADDERRLVAQGGLLGDLLGGLGGLGNLGNLGGLGGLLGLDGLGLDGLLGGVGGLGGPFVGTERRRREDDQLSFSLRAEYALPKSLFLLGRYEYTDNNSNFDNFDYDRNVVTLGLGGRF